VKVSVVRGGGLAGLVQTTIADSETLAPEHAAQLRAKVDEAGFFGLPDNTGRSPGAADRFDYAVTVEDADRTHTVRRAESELPAAVQELIAWVNSVPGRQDRLAPPGEPAAP
jgi:hypothetical protein